MKLEEAWRKILETGDLMSVNGEPSVSVFHKTLEEDPSFDEYILVAEDKCARISLTEKGRPIILENKEIVLYHGRAEIYGNIIRYNNGELQFDRWYNAVRVVDERTCLVYDSNSHVAIFHHCGDNLADQWFDDAYIYTWDRSMGNAFVVRLHDKYNLFWGCFMVFDEWINGPIYPSNHPSYVLVRTDRGLMAHINLIGNPSWSILGNEEFDEAYGFKDTAFRVVKNRVKYLLYEDGHLERSDWD